VRAGATIRGFLGTAAALVHGCVEVNAMTIWMVIFSLFGAPADAFSPNFDGAIREDSPMRYHGIERLLAKFEAQGEPVAVADQNR
jgi:hypothetical protein